MRIFSYKTAMILFVLALLFTGCSNQRSTQPSTQLKTFTFPTAFLEKTEDRAAAIKQFTTFVNGHIKRGMSKDTVVKKLGYGELNPLSEKVTTMKYALVYGYNMDLGTGVDYYAFLNKQIGAELFVSFDTASNKVINYELYYVDPKKDQKSEMLTAMKMLTENGTKYRISYDGWYPRPTKLNYPEENAYGNQASLVDEQYAWSLNSTDGQDNFLIRTTDGGKTWEKLGFISQLAPNYSIRNGANGVQFLNRKRGWLLGRYQVNNRDRNAIYMTIDGGQSWKPQELPPIPTQIGEHDFSTLNHFESRDLIFFNKNEGIVLMNTDNGGEVKWTWIYASQDGGKTWSKPLPLAGLKGEQKGSILSIKWDFSQSDTYKFTLKNETYIFGVANTKWVKITKE